MMSVFALGVFVLGLAVGVVGWVAFKAWLDNRYWDAPFDEEQEPWGYNNYEGGREAYQMGETREWVKRAFGDDGVNGYDDERRRATGRE